MNGKAKLKLVSDLKLPDAFRAKTDVENSLVELKAQGKPTLKVSISSFASVASALALFAPDGEPTSTSTQSFTLTRDKDGKSIKLNAGALYDVALAMSHYSLGDAKEVAAAKKRKAAQLSNTPPASGVKPGRRPKTQLTPKVSISKQGETLSNQQSDEAILDMLEREK